MTLTLNIDATVLQWAILAAAMIGLAFSTRHLRRNSEPSQ